jgi:transcriptional regulator with GAF, ATPase, and Fis domain
MASTQDPAGAGPAAQGKGSPRPTLQETADRDLAMNDLGADRTALTATTFVEIVDTLVGDFDVIDVLTSLTSRCVELLDVAAAGILLADEEGFLRVIGSSTEEIQLLELFQLQRDEGPCLDCYRTGAVVAHARLDTETPWPEFAAECLRAGFPSVCAVPLRLKDIVLGCLNLFMRDPTPLAVLDILLARALADVASIAIVQDQATRQAAIREGQLQHALNSRIAIEQAKGMLAEYGRVDMDQAFARLRGFARNHNRGLTEVAEALVRGDIVVSQMAPGRVPPPPPSGAKPATA